jgi:Adenylate and Guanylate cyclase catalytic domain
MNDRVNKTSICSIVFLDIIDYSKRPDSEQIDVKNQFNALINIALKDYAQNDRIILDSGDGAAIAYMGSPEDALFMAMSIRDGILKNNESAKMLMHVRFGINLGPVRVVNDINGRPNIIGDGINVAQRIMSFAQPNQILVSRSYYEITSRLTQEISQMFDYSGVKHDKHVRDHEVYSVRSTKGIGAVENQAEAITDNLPLINPLAGLSIPSLSKINWNYAAPAVFVLVTLFAISKLAFAPNEPANIANIASKPATAATAVVVAPIKPAKTEVVAPSKPANEVLANNVPANETLEKQKTLEQKKASQKLAKKKAKQKAKMPPEFAPQHTDIAQNPNKPNEQTTKTADSRNGQAKPSPKPSHSTVNTSVISTPVQKCSQAQTAMGQCN